MARNAQLRTKASSGNVDSARLVRGLKEPDPRKSTAKYAGSTASGNASRSADSLLTLRSASSRGHTKPRLGAHVPAHGSIGDLAGVQSRLSKPLSIFYGYPAELIARWCGVSLSTARLYKSGARKPSRQALRLFGLHRDGRVLGPEWRDWSVKGDKLVSPANQETTQGQLNAYWLIMQLARELARDNPKATEEFYRLLRSA